MRSTTRYSNDPCPRCAMTGAVATTTYDHGERGEQRYTTETACVFCEWEPVESTEPEPAAKVDPAVRHELEECECFTIEGKLRNGCRWDRCMSPDGYIAPMLSGDEEATA